MRLNGKSPSVLKLGGYTIGISLVVCIEIPVMLLPALEPRYGVPFNLNPHYLDVDLQSKHMGETRETRIKEFHAFNDIPVLGLREGSWLEVTGETIILKGNLTARWFTANNEAVELETGTRLEILK